MKKSVLLFSVAVLALASCNKTEYLGQEGLEGKSPIEIGSTTLRGTKAHVTGQSAAERLGNKFKVYGLKTTGSDEQTVFNGVPVIYSSEKWDYTSASELTRYWDPNATQYDFLAFSDANTTQKVVAPAIADLFEDGITIGTATSNVTLAELQKIYVAPSLTIENGAFTSPVNFVFRNAAAKIRVAFFNAIPGYDVKINKFYPANPAVTDDGKTNVILFGDNAFFTAAAYSVDPETAATTVIGTPAKTGKIELGAKCTEGYIGRNITDASFDKADKAWTMVMPVNDAAKDINLVISYTLQNLHETIERTSFVTIPAVYAQWASNHAYTYYFRITDNDLHPITFSAEVIDFEETGYTQETITTIDGEQEANITTWAAGSAVQENKAYKVGELIYVAVTNVTVDAQHPITVQVAYTDDLTVDGSNAGAKIAEGSYQTMARGDDNRSSFTANAAGKWVIRVKYKDSQDQDKTAFKVVTVTSDSE